jgi:hypothetical protein
MTLVKITGQFWRINSTQLNSYLLDPDSEEDGNSKEELKTLLEKRRFSSECYSIFPYISSWNGSGTMILAFHSNLILTPLG